MKKLWGGGENPKMEKSGGGRIIIRVLFSPIIKKSFLPVGRWSTSYLISWLIVSAEKSIVLLVAISLMVDF